MPAFAVPPALVAAVLAALVAVSPCAAATYTFDPQRTVVKFTYAIAFVTGHGKFTRVRGTVDYDQAAPAKAKSKCIIDTTSLSADDPIVEGQLRGPDFFNVEASPEMTFVSGAVRPTGPGTMQMAGNLTINGITKPVLLHSSIEPQAGGKPAGAQLLISKMRIRRSDFGMTGFMLLVGDDVDIEIDSILLPAR